MANLVEVMANRVALDTEESLTRFPAPPRERAGPVHRRLNRHAPASYPTRDRRDTRARGREVKNGCLAASFSSLHNRLRSATATAFARLFGPARKDLIPYRIATVAAAMTRIYGNTLLGSERTGPLP
jgi:hypothetical protein